MSSWSYCRSPTDGPAPGLLPRQGSRVDRFTSHVDLARHGRRDEGGAVLLQPLDRLADLGDEGVDLGGLAIEESSDGVLLDLWRDGDVRALQVTDVDPADRRPGCTRRELCEDRGGPEHEEHPHYVEGGGGRDARSVLREVGPLEFVGHDLRGSNAASNRVHDIPGPQPGTDVLSFDLERRAI